MNEVIGFVIAVVTTALLFFMIGFFCGCGDVDVKCDDCGRIYDNRDVYRLSSNPNVGRLSSNDDLLILCDGCYKKTISNLVKDKMIFLENKEK